MRSNRHRHPQDALRWLMGHLITAILASAVTSAVFLAARPKTPAPDPMRQRLETAREQLKTLAPELEAAAKARLDAPGAAAGPTTVAAVYRTGAAASGDGVPMLAPDDNMLMMGESTPWQLDVTTTSPQRRFGRIVDIRESASLSRPGYLGTVELVVETQQRGSQISGSLPFAPPQGYRVISPAEYSELSQSREYNVALASHDVEETHFQFEDWSPATPPPADLPELVQQQFNDAVLQCAATKPKKIISRETLTFYFSLSERKWTARP